LNRFNARSTTTVNQQYNYSIMAKALTKSQIAAEIAEKNSITKKQAVEILGISRNCVATRGSHLVET
jgi:hypothetical protein